MPEIVRLLADSGAAELQDEGGMLPLHYASAYGTTREVLEVLLENYPESIAKTENKGRNPLHLAMVNAHRQSSPKVVGFLLEKNADEIINSYDDDNHLPIHLLAMASKFPPEKVVERKNAADCLALYLDARPKSSADFLTAIQTLPEWLRDIAVISDHIQDVS
jgi:ankyrin repeat protein